MRPWLEHNSHPICLENLISSFGGWSQLTSSEMYFLSTPGRHVHPGKTSLEQWRGARCLPTRAHFTVFNLHVGLHSFPLSTSRGGVMVSTGLGRWGQGCLGAEECGEGRRQVWMSRFSSDVLHKFLLDTDCVVSPARGLPPALLAPLFPYVTTLSSLHWNFCLLTALLRAGTLVYSALGL